MSKWSIEITVRIDTEKWREFHGSEYRDPWVADHVKWEIERSIARVDGHLDDGFVEWATTSPWTYQCDRCGTVEDSIMHSDNRPGLCEQCRLDDMARSLRG